MDRIFKDLSHVLWYQDDILVTGKSREEHLKNLAEVLQRLQSNGLTVQRDKCEFMQPSFRYLGHIIDQDDIRPLNDKDETIKLAPLPEDTTQLRAFLGLINYYQVYQVARDSTNAKHNIHCHNRSISWTIYTFRHPSAHGQRQWHQAHDDCTLPSQ